MPPADSSWKCATLYDAIKSVNKPLISACYLNYTTYWQCTLSTPPSLRGSSQWGQCPLRHYDYYTALWGMRRSKLLHNYRQYLDPSIICQILCSKPLLLKALDTQNPKGRGPKIVIRMQIIIMMSREKWKLGNIALEPEFEPTHLAFAASVITITLPWLPHAIVPFKCPWLCVSLCEKAVYSGVEC